MWGEETNSWNSSIQGVPPCQDKSQKTENPKQIEIQIANITP